MTKKQRNSHLFYTASFVSLKHFVMVFQRENGKTELPQEKSMRQPE